MNPKDTFKLIDISNELLSEIFDHARADYPNESCGFVVLDGSGKRSVYRCENLQDKLHALDPETYPRTARTAYNLDPRAFMRVEAEGKQVLVLYHSHCDAGAYFSDEDRRAAAWDGEPVYPGLKYLVVSVIGGKVVDMAGFAWDLECKNFQNEPVPALFSAEN